MTHAFIGSRRTLPGSLTLLLALVPLVAQSQTSYQQTNLVSDIPGLATFTDPNLVNPWGISESGAGPFWVSNNGTGTSTLYNTQGAIIPLVVNIPTPTATGGGAVTGQVFNSGPNFLLPGGKSAFIFATEGGTISAWNGAAGTNAVLKVDNSNSAIYKGLAIGNNGAGDHLYAADFKGGKIDVFDGSFAAATLSGSFVDPTKPANYAPFNIQNLGGKLYVTYAQLQAGSNDEEAGAGKGFVSVFDLNGNFLGRVASGTGAGGTLTTLNAPWGLALAPVGFGTYSGDLLVGNFGDGTISAFDPTSGAFLGQLQGVGGSTLAIDGLWGLQFGNGGNGGKRNTLYFAAGIDGEAHGLFGSLQAVPEPGMTALLAAGIVSCGGLLLRRRKTKG